MLGLPAAAAGSLGLSVLLVVRLVRHERLVYAVSGLSGVAVGVVLALWSGQAEGFFLPGIVTSALLGVACVARPERTFPCPVPMAGRIGRA